jgi:hypothetical protein
MSRFAQALSDVASRLTLPEPVRSRVLLEMAADMEDLHQAYLERGLPEEEARASVLEHFDLSQEALRELAAVHDSPLERSLTSLSGQAHRPWARTLLGLLGLFVAAGNVSLFFEGGLLSHASPLAWVLLAILATGLAGGAWKARLLRSSPAPGEPRVRSGVSFLLGLAGLQVVLGFAGVWVELYRSGLRIRSAPGEALIHIVGWMHLASATLVVALSSALILGFLWFFLEGRAQRLQAAAAASLLEADG